MLSKEDFITKYQGYTEDELLDAYREINDYSEEAKEALRIVISQRGGEEKLIETEDKKGIFVKELQRVKDSVIKLSTPDVELSFLQKMITSDILSPQELNREIEHAYRNFKSHQHDKQVNEKTVVMSIIGCCVAGLIGGIYFGLQLIYSERIFIILLIGLVIICYGIIRLFIRKSYKNTAVLVATIISIVLSGLVGKILYGIVGYQG